MVWLPEAGVGFYPVRAPAAAVYDDAYFKKYQDYAATPMGEDLRQARLDLLAKHIGAGGGAELKFVDFGVGCGDFVQALGCRGFDVMPAARKWLHQRGQFVDVYAEGADVLTCWDSLEHVACPERLLPLVRDWLFVSLPIFTGAEHAAGSKHFRRDEHFWYWTDAGFRRFLEWQGFEVVEANTMESDLGREDIATYAARRTHGAMAGIHG